MFALAASFAFFLTPAVQAGAGVVDDAAGTVGGALGGVAGNASGTLGGATGSRQGDSLPASGPLFSIGGDAAAQTGSTFFGRPDALNRLAFQMHVPLGAAMAALIELRQRVEGRLIAVTAAGEVSIETSAGTRHLSAAPDVADDLRPFLGRSVIVRSADGVHVTSIVGKHDFMRGVVVSVADRMISFISANGEVHTISVTHDDLTRLAARVGSQVVAVSDDFDKTARFSVLRISPGSVLADVSLATVAQISGRTLIARVDGVQRHFTIDPTLAHTLARLVGKTVALDVPDGIHVKTLISAAILDRLLSPSTHPTGGAIVALVVATSRTRVTAQLPNGDLVSYLVRGPGAVIRNNTALTITPLDAIRARLRVGARVFDAVDASACATVNTAGCSAKPERGSVLAIDPTDITIRFGDGDVRTFLGDLSGLRVNVGVPVTIEPLDSVHVRLVAAGTVAQLVAARACVTINSGCRAMAGTVSDIVNGGFRVALADGSSLPLDGGAALGLTTSQPVVVQALDGTHAIVTSGASVASVVNATACASVNATCVASGPGADLGNAPNNGAPNNGAPNNGGGGNADTGGNPGANGGTPNGGNPDTGSHPGIGPGIGPVLSGTIVGQAQFAAANSMPTTCAADGQAIVTVVDSAGKPLPNVKVDLIGRTSTTWLTDGKGTMRFYGLPAGTYRAQVTKLGYKPLTSDPFRVDCLGAVSIIVRLDGLRHTTGASTANIGRISRLTVASATGPGTSACVMRSAATGHAWKAICTR